MKTLRPYIISWLGAAADYITSYIGINHLGCIETHANYSPFFALSFFTLIIAFLSSLLPATKVNRAFIYAVALASWLGPINNILVILAL